MASTAASSCGPRVSSGIGLITTNRICNPTHVEPESSPICKAVSETRDIHSFIHSSEAVELSLERSGGLYGDFGQVISRTSKFNDGVVITGSDGTVSATGQIVSQGDAHPTNVKTAYVHFHRHGIPVDGSQYPFIILPRRTFVCPIADGESLVPVLSAYEPLSTVIAEKRPSTVIVKDLDVDSLESESDRNCLWYVGSASGDYYRLYVMPDGVKRLYMAAHGDGRIFLTEDERVPNEGHENPETDMLLYFKYHQNNDNSP